MSAAQTRKNTLDFIAIGESLRDVFYSIHDATVSCSIHKERCLLCLEYAEKIPVQQVVKVPAAGNSSNAAVAAARLGLKAALVSWIGKDEAGQHMKVALRHEGVDLRLLSHDTARPTSEATIITFQGERTQLVYFQPRTYRLPTLPATRCIYYSAMGEKHTAFDRALLKELGRRPQTFFSFQPGTTHVRQGLKAIEPLIAMSHLFILNKEEAHRLLDDGERTVQNMLEHFHKLGAKRIVITDGPNGADAYDGTAYWHMPIFAGEAKERTGAGDSFSSAATVAILKGFDLPTALRWGAANSWSVIQHIGPQSGLLGVTGIQRILKRFSTTKAITN